MINIYRSSWNGQIDDCSINVFHGRDFVKRGEIVLKNKKLAGTGEYVYAEPAAPGRYAFGGTIMKYTAIHSDGNKSVGMALLKREPEKKIFAFSVHGKIYWSGDLQTYRKTKRDAYRDAEIKFPSDVTNKQLKGVA